MNMYHSCYIPFFHTLRERLRVVTKYSNALVEQVRAKKRKSCSVSPCALVKHHVSRSEMLWEHAILYYRLRTGVCKIKNNNNNNNNNSVALVRERTIPTERPLFAGEVSANFCE
jgi:hypothetical protein